MAPDAVTPRRAGLKIEPPEGDMTRQSAPRLHSMALYFAQRNCGKRNVSLDVTQTAGRDVARE